MIEPIQIAPWFLVLLGLAILTVGLGVGCVVALTFGGPSLQKRHLLWLASGYLFAVGIALVIFGAYEGHTPGSDTGPLYTAIGVAALAVGSAAITLGVKFEQKSEQERSSRK